MKARAVKTLAVCLVVVLVPVVACAAGGGSAGGKAPAGETPDIEMLYHEALHLEEGEGDLAAAIKAYERVVKEHEKSAALAARAQFHIARAFERLGKKDEAIAAYREVARRFVDSPEAAPAAERIKALAPTLPAPTPAVRDTTSDLLRREIERKLQTRVPNFNFPDATLHVILNIVREIGEVNIVVDPACAPAFGTVSLSLRNVSVAEILNHVTRTVRLDWTIWENAVYISDADEIEELEREPQMEDLRKSELELLDAKIEAAVAAFVRTGELVRRQAVPESELEQASIRIAEAELEKKRFLLGPAPGEKAAPSAQLADEIDSTFTRVATPERTGWPGATEVTLYDIQITNFSGPQLLDLDSGETAPFAGGGTDFFAERPRFDLVFTDRAVIVDGGRTTGLQYKGSFILNDTCGAVLAPAGTTVETARATRDFPEADHWRVSRRETALGVWYQLLAKAGELPIIVATDRGKFLVQTLSMGEDTVRIAYEKVEDLPRRGEDYLIRKLQSERETYERARRQEEARSGDPVDVVGQVRYYLERHDATSARLVALAEGERKAKAQRYHEQVAASAESASGYAEQVNQTRQSEVDVKIYRTDLPNFVGPQVFDIDSGRADVLPEGMGAKEFFEKNSAFDLAYFPGGAVMANRGIQAATVSRREVDARPELIRYDEPASAAENIIYDDQGKLKPFRPGVYKDDAGFIIIRSDICAVKTDSGEYLLYNMREREQYVSFQYRKMVERGTYPSLDLPPFEFE